MRNRLKAGTVPPLYQGVMRYYVTGVFWEGNVMIMIWSQENCLFNNHRYYLREIGRGLFTGSHGFVGIKLFREYSRKGFLYF